ncbi:hypothetical protein EV421DRAFT_1907437 [Armillaria borealis]|uniref:Extracellular metalloproteinase n=1 Tax=Armillaria borealis TaxID=47425 RepID=A0AA39J762_9AGAR|nr:hypothetical protein EV421DRAFT_1907437 [Armillaria borealis]
MGLMIVWDLQDARTIWTLITPQHDGLLENYILVHQWLGTVRCLQTTEADGMSDGSQTPCHPNVPNLARWVHNNLSENTSTPPTPFKYSSIYQVHDIGEARTNMLHDVYIALVEAHGLSSTAIDDKKDTSSGSVSSSTRFRSDCVILPDEGAAVPNA